LRSRRRQTPSQTGPNVARSGGFGFVAICFGGDWERKALDNIKRDAAGPLRPGFLKLNLLARTIQSSVLAPEPLAACQIFGPLRRSNFFRAEPAVFAPDLRVFGATGLAATGRVAG